MDKFREIKEQSPASGPVETSEPATTAAISRLSKTEQINLINSVVNNADLHFDPTKVNAKFKPTPATSIQDQEAIEQQNGLLLFSTSGKLSTNASESSSAAGENSMNQYLDTMNNPESILSKLIEFRSNVTPSDLI